MKKLLYILAFLPLIANAQINVGRFKGNTIQRNYAVDTIIGYWANNNGTGYAGFLASIDTTNFTAFGIDTLNYDALIYSDNGGFRFIGDDGGVFSDSYYSLTVPSAQLAVNSTTRGFLCPRMTTAQRDLISSPATGLMIYNTTTNAFNYYNAGWQAIGSSGIAPGTTAVSPTVTGSILMDIGGVVTESISYRAQQATPYSTAFGFDSHSSGSFSGVDNSSFGYQAGKAITTATDNALFGFQAGLNLSTGGQNTFVGSLAGTTASTQTGNTGVGYQALTITDATGNTALGYQAGHNARGNYNTFIGWRNNYTGSTATFSISIGTQVSPIHSNSIVIASYLTSSATTTTATHQGILGANDANGYISDWYYNGVTHTAPYSVTLNASGGSGSNVAGANYTDAAGRATGTGASGNKKSQTSVKGSSGSTLQSLTDRQAIIGKYVDLTESSATTFGTLALTTSGTIAGGVIVYTVEANDGTDYQSLTGTAPYSVVNKAGTLTLTLGTDTQISACSTGTLTGTLTVAASGTSLQWRMNAVSSLSQTVLRISFQVLNNFGVATILPA